MGGCLPGSRRAGCKRPPSPPRDLRRRTAWYTAQEPSTPSAYLLPHSYTPPARPQSSHHGGGNTQTHPREKPRPARVVQEPHALGPLLVLVLHPVRADEGPPRLDALYELRDCLFILAVVVRREGAFGVSAALFLNRSCEVSWGGFGLGGGSGPGSDSQTELASRGRDGRPAWGSEQRPTWDAVCGRG